LVFAVSLFAFSNMLFIQLGTSMKEFSTQFTSLITLGRALFGDFDMTDVISNSPNYGNTILYLLYLFCAIFVLLSMFLAMLGEAQANLRDDQRDARKEAEKKGEQLPPEYGILYEGQRAIAKGLMRVPVLRKLVKDPDAMEMHEKGTLMSVFEEQMQQIDRLEEYTLSLDVKVEDLMAAFKASMSMWASERSLKMGGVDVGGPLGQLSVKLHSASGLKAKDINGKSDPYVIFKFGTEAEVRSSIKGKTLTPQWEESFVISERMSATHMLSGKLSVTVMDKDAGAVHDMFDSTDDKLGECVVSLSVLDGKPSHEFKQPLSPKGTIHFTVSFSPRGGPSISLQSQQPQANSRGNDATLERVERLLLEMREMHEMRWESDPRRRHKAGGREISLMRSVKEVTGPQMERRSSRGEESRGESRGGSRSAPPARPDDRKAPESTHAKGESRPGDARPNEHRRHHGHGSREHPGRSMSCITKEHTHYEERAHNGSPTHNGERAHNGSPDVASHKLRA